MNYHIYKNALYYGKSYVGVVVKLDYRNGTHGYSISKVSNQTLLQDFHEEARRLFSYMENPYITYLDILM